MRVNSYEYACLIDQFWFEYELHVSSSWIQIFESLLSWHFLYMHLNIWISFHAHLSCMLLHVAITLFSPAHPHAHFIFLLSSQTRSFNVSLEKCHTLLIITSKRARATHVLPIQSIFKFHLYLICILFYSFCLSTPFFNSNN